VVKSLVAEAGFMFGVASDSGSIALHEDLYELRRIGVFPNTDGRGFRRKITGRYLQRKQR
jgi:hypothetical protein